MTYEELKKAYEIAMQKCSELESEKAELESEKTELEQKIEEQNKEAQKCRKLSTTDANYPQRFKNESLFLTKWGLFC